MGAILTLLTSLLLLANGGNLSRMVSALRSKKTAEDLSRGWWDKEKGMMRLIPL